MQEHREFMISILSIIKSSEGCESGEMFQNQEDLSKFVIIENWASMELHQAAVKTSHRKNFLTYGCWHLRLQAVGMSRCPGNR